MGSSNGNGSNTVQCIRINQNGVQGKAGKRPELTTGTTEYEIHFVSKLSSHKPSH